MPGSFGKNMGDSENTTKSKTPVVDFSNTEIAFKHKNNQELRKTSWLFRFMNKSWLVQPASSFGLWLNENRINIFNPIVRKTFFWQFCGGTTLEDSREVIDHLRENNTLTVLDYGVEGKTTEKEFDSTLAEILRAIRFASSNPGVPVVSTKLTSLASNDLLEKYQSGETLNADEKESFENFFNRVDRICREASENNIAVFIDAEETWMQDTIDHVAKSMMEKYNRERAVVYHAYQMYRKDKYESLLADHREAREKNYILGAKIVRGAYMEKERKRAEDMGYPSPIQNTKQDTDKDFNAAIQYCADHYTEIALCNATHNVFSNQLLADMIAERGIPKNHPHLYFCQLFGMSDNITFNLASAGYNVAKILPYGPVKEVIPYLIRRARENTAVTGEMSRELSLVMEEMKRRGLK